MIRVDAVDYTFSAVMMHELPGKVDWIIGEAVFLAFKESEVSLAKNLSGTLSLRNQMEATIKTVKKGTVLAVVEMEFNGLPLTSVITSGSANRLELASGDTVTALVKSTETMIIKSTGA